MTTRRWGWPLVSLGSLRLTLALLTVVLLSACAAHALWLNGHPPILENYTNVTVRIYRAGMECRIEVMTATDSIITLPTRCLTVPRIAKQ